MTWMLARQQGRLRPRLRLQALALIEPEEVASLPALARDVRDLTNEVIAEAEDAGRAALAAAGSREQPHSEVFLWVRLARLMTAADDAVAAASAGDAPRLRRQLRHFEDLLSAIWTVQRAVLGQ